MVTVVNYANKAFRNAQRINSICAKRFGADKVLQYKPSDIDEEFKRDNSRIINAPRGNGYWLWKPYIIRDALTCANYGDYVFYIDSGAALIKPIDELIKSMKENNTDIMCFSLSYPERIYCKRDALVLMEADIPKYYESPQIMASYILLQKTERTIKLVDNWLEYAVDERIITDNSNVMHLENYAGFIENRHDQTIWSLLCKKNNIQPFRDPSQYGNDKSKFSAEVNDRSKYSQVIFHHRDRYICSVLEIPEARRWYDIFDAVSVARLSYKYLKRIIFS